MHSETRPPRPARRPVLRPGVHVLRRSADELQVGLDPRRALVLPDRPEVRSLLEGLQSPASAVGPTAYDDRALALLAEGGLLADADTLLPLVPAGPAPASPDGQASHDQASTGAHRAAVAALAAHAGDGAADLLAARAGARIEVVTSGGGDSTRVATCLGALLSAAGLPYELCGRAPRPTEARPGLAPADARVTRVLVAVGEPPREHLDPWMRDGTPHLLLRLTEGTAVIGPFVHPGQSACLRCVDAHHTDVDPAWPLLVAQYASAVGRDRQDAIPEPVDPILASLAVAWAARELASHAEGRRPPTTSTTIRLDPHLTALETQHWPRHPACGCCWS